MKKLLRYLPLHFVICLIVGIVLQFYTTIWQLQFTYIITFFVVFLLLLFLFHLIKKRFLFTICSWLFFIYLGIVSVWIQDNRNNSKNYTNFISKTTTTVFIVTKVLKPGNYYDKYLVEVSQVNQQKTVGSVLLNIQKDSLQIPLQVDDKIFLTAVFKPLIPPLNPHQFSYKNYLAKQGVHHQVFVINHQYKKVGKRTFSLLGIAFNIRKKVQESLQKYPFSKDEFAVISALLLGQRQDISKGLIANYAKAGAIHILAVSGLHVGILLLILSTLLQPLEKLKKGKLVKTIFIIFLLWMFAFIAGLSASVVRAVTMFTFVAIGQASGKKRMVFYSLFTSLFVLLMAKPMFLFDVGFQLSYLAVFGIVWVQPKLHELWQPKLKILDKFWQLFTVSIAAQFGILPLSLYYFHQFPGLFVLSNLVIIPFLGAVLIGGIAVITLAILNILPVFLAEIYGHVISLMNGFVTWVATQEQFLFTQISFSFKEMIFWYVVIILGFQFFIKRNAKKMLYFLGSILLLQGVYFYQKYEMHQKKEFLVFHKSRYSLVGNRLGGNLKVFHTLDTTKVSTEKILLSYQLGEQVTINTTNKIPNIIQLKNRFVLVVDSLGIYKLSKFKNSIVILQFSPKINLQRLINELQPIQIVADGSNYKTTILQWKKTCKKNKIPFYYTGQNGAFIINE